MYGHATLRMSNILHTQYSIGTCIQHNWTIPSLEVLPKPIALRCSNKRGRWTHRSTTEPYTIQPHSAPWIKAKNSTQTTSGHLQHGCAASTSTTSCATSEGGNTKTITADNATTRHNSASGTCNTSEGESKRSSNHNPRACTTERNPNKTPCHQRLHRGTLITDALIWWEVMQHSTGTQIQ